MLVLLSFVLDRPFRRDRVRPVDRDVRTDEVAERTETVLATLVFDTCEVLRIRRCRGPEAASAATAMIAVGAEMFAAGGSVVRALTSSLVMG